MQKTNDYENVEGFAGDFEVLKLGGKKCIIRQAREEKSKTGNDMLVIEFDIAEGENKGFYQRQYDRSADNVKWKGVHRLMLLDNEGKTNKFFKGFITSVEESSSGFKWDWKEELLKGKLFGGVFGREQFEKDGELKMTTKLRFIRSIKDIEKVEAPEDKMLKKEFYPVSENEPESDLPF